MTRPMRGSVSAREARHGAWLPIVLLALGLFLVFGAALMPGEGLYFRDHINAFRPQWWSVHTQVWSGVFPALDITHSSGRPLESSTGFALFTPATIILLCGPFDVTYDLFVVFHFVVLAAGVFVFARRLGAKNEAAVAASAVASLSGPVLGFENLVVGLQGIAWSPWLWCALDASIRRPSPQSAAALGLALFLAVQGVMPELVLVDLFVLAGLLMFRRPRINVGLLGVWGAALVSGAIASAPDWVPMLEALAESRRGAGFEYAEASGWALGPIQALDLFIPSFWYSPQVFFFDLPPVLGETPDIPYLISLYFGGAIAVGLAAPLRRNWMLVAAVGALFVLIAMGEHTPLHRALVALPGFSSSRFAIKYLVGTAFALALLCGATLMHLESCAKRLAVASALLVGLAGACWVVVEMPEFRAFLDTYGRPFARGAPFERFERVDIVADVIRSMRGQLLHAAAVGAALFVIAASIVLGPLQGATARWMVAGVLVMDLGVAGRSSVLTSKDKAMNVAPEVARAFGPDRPWALIGPPPPVVDVPGQSTYRDYASHRAAYGLHAWEHLRIFALDELEGLAIQGPHRAYHRAIRLAIEAKDDEIVQRLWSDAGIRFVIRPASSFPPSWLSNAERVERHTDAVGREIEVWSLRGRPYADAFTAARRTPTPSGAADPTRFVVASVATSSVACEARVDVEAADFTDISLDADLDCPGFVSIAEVAAPGWTATVDGKPVQIASADAGYLAAPVPEGSHRVRFSYASRAQALLPLMAIGLFAMLALWGFGYWEMRS